GIGYARTKRNRLFKFVLLTELAAFVGQFRFISELLDMPHCKPRVHTLISDLCRPYSPTILSAPMARSYYVAISLPRHDGGEKYFGSAKGQDIYGSSEASKNRSKNLPATAIRRKSKGGTGIGKTVTKCNTLLFREGFWAYHA